MNRKKIFSLLTVLLFAAFLAVSLVACGGGAEEDPDEGTEVTVSSLTVAQDVTKRTYEEGEDFDSDGLVVNANMSDGTVEEDVDYSIKSGTELTTSASYVIISYSGRTLYYTITVTYKGNNEKYSVENTDVLDDSPLEGDTYFFLGSSVTYGYGSDGESMVDFIAKRNSCTCIKEAVSGTTLADIEDSTKGDSYVKRLESYIASEDRAEELDVFVCQLSTNDMYDSSTFGEVTDTSVYDIDSFDKETTFGAMEYITALVGETWDCPVLFYTNNNMGNENYEVMVQAAHDIEDKWESVYVLDLYNDEEFNDITSEEEALYMTDNVHPTKAGYLLWWTPEFEEILADITGADTE